MIGDFFLVVWIAMIAVPLYWFIPARWASARLALVCLISIFLIGALSPVAVFALAGNLALLWLFSGLRLTGLAKNTLKMLSWLAFAPLLLFEFVPGELAVRTILGPDWLVLPKLSILAFAGTSYMAIRSFIMIREMLDDKRPTFLEATLTLCFFGSFLAGPISGSMPYRERKALPDFSDLILGLSRIGWGGALFLFFKPLVASFDPASQLGLAADGTAHAWVVVFRHFLTLYIDFTGYSDIAIGLALLFGFRLPENFNWPLRSTSIQEFWQRWHMSLGAFIGTYLFKPLVRHFGSPRLAIFVAFCAVGLWHKIALPYFIWGICHGAALAGNMALKKYLPSKHWPQWAQSVQKVAGWFFVMTFVALLSSFATSPSSSAAIALMGRLVGIG